MNVGNSRVVLLLRLLLPPASEMANCDLTPALIPYKPSSLIPYAFLRFEVLVCHTPRAVWIKRDHGPAHRDMANISIQRLQTLRHDKL